MSKTFSGVPGDSRCECTDSLCGVHIGSSKCEHKASIILYRIDMEDQTGTAFCDGCADDAMECGLFTDSAETDEETEVTE